jgi:hypothetical protein
VGGELGSGRAFLQPAHEQFVQMQNTPHYLVRLSYRISFGH